MTDEELLRIYENSKDKMIYGLFGDKYNVTFEDFVKMIGLMLKRDEETPKEEKPKLVLEVGKFYRREDNKKVVVYDFCHCRYHIATLGSSVLGFGIDGIYTVDEKGIFSDDCPNNIVAEWED